MKAATSVIYHLRLGVCPDCESFSQPGSICVIRVVEVEGTVEPRIEKHDGTTIGPHETPPRPTHKRRVKKPKKLERE